MKCHTTSDEKTAECLTHLVSPWSLQEQQPFFWIWQSPTTTKINAATPPNTFRNIPTISGSSNKKQKIYILTQKYHHTDVFNVMRRGIVRMFFSLCTDYLQTSMGCGLHLDVPASFLAWQWYSPASSFFTDRNFFWPNTNDKFTVATEL